MCEDAIEACSSNPDIVFGIASQVRFRRLNVVIGMSLEEDMIESGMVGYKIQHQSEAALTKTTPQLPQRIISAHQCRYGIVPYGETGPTDIHFLQVRQSLIELLTPDFIAE